MVDAERFYHEKNDTKDRIAKPAKLSKLILRKRSKMQKLEILKNQSAQKAQRYFNNIASIFEWIEIQKICF